MRAGRRPRDVGGEDARPIGLGAGTSDVRSLEPVGMEEHCSRRIPPGLVCRR